MRKKLTIDEIAKIAGVSKATVSRVLNEKKEVKEETREKIRKIIDEYDYVPSSLARGLSHKQANSLGLVIPHTAEYLFSSPYFSEFVRGISHHVNQSGYQLILATSSSEKPKQQVYRDMINSDVVAGVVILDLQQNDERFDYLDREKVPFVVVGSPVGYSDVDYVDSDNLGGAKQATEYLLRLGHDRVLLLNGSKEYVVSINRQNGYLEALAAEGIPREEGWILYGDFSAEYGYESIRSILATGECPPAVFATSDLAAMGAVMAYKEAGIAVGTDVSVIGFDDIPFAKIFEPSLSTVHQPIYEIGEEAGRILIRRMAENEEGYIHRILENELVIRESTIPRNK